MFDTNIFNLILVGLIFLSLVVIISILGRNIRKIKEFQVLNGTDAIKELPKSNGKVRRIFRGLLNIIKNVLIAFAEWIVKHAKKLLHLVHFWLIKLKREKKGDEALDEIEAKEELINEEEKNLNEVIHEDLGRAEEEEALEDVFTSRRLDEQDSIVQNDDQAELDIKEEERKEEIGKKNKIKNFFLSRRKRDIAHEDIEVEKEVAAVQEGEMFFDQQPQEEEVQEGLVKKFLGKINVFSKKDKSQEMDETDQMEYENNSMQDSFKEEFSDGVVKIKKSNARPNEELLMKEVVVAKHRHEQVDLDDELGVDRKILEKKILQKIAGDPKNVEHYRQLGELYIKMKNFSDAEGTYKFIIKVSPRDVDAKRKIEKIKLFKRLN